ncbi:MAG: c-type cytochrome biogenesis protein CcsB [Syntrophobacterales bacterium]|jgi:cytochrome c-type biogenesis protein CcsB|nr:c-type cytochrome biogenesis protein CcsB [Syntrophobacterales bacterium]
MSIFLLITSLCFYLVSTLLYLTLLVSGKKGLGIPAHLSLIAGFFLQFISLVLRYVEAGYTPTTNLHEALLFLSFCIAGFYLYLRRIYRIEIIGCIIAAILAVILIWAVMFPVAIKPLPPVLRSYWLPIHAIFSFVGNAIFFISFCVSILYLAAERSIKRKTLFSLSLRIPSLETLDSINYTCISYGFPFLTMGIITGSIWAGLAWGSHWNWDPKETWSLITWILYAILFHNRLAIGWRGRKTAYMMIVGFFSLLFTFLGVNLLIGGLHSYANW